MQLDMFGKKRYKVNLHTHTTLSDGRKIPEEVIELYRAKGYDAVALTDHWYYGKGYDANGLTVLSGAEYNSITGDCRDGVYHIVGIGMNYEPSLTVSASPQKIIDEIHRAGGLAILAHPAWSLNTLEQILPLENVDATEIYNTVSGVHNSRRPDSSLIIDLLASNGRFYPLVADDDAHFYDNDNCVSWIMVEANDNSSKELCDAIRKGNFYATQGPEIHLCREKDNFLVQCSPCQKITFYSNSVSLRTFWGDGLTEARYELPPDVCFIRAEATDQNGNSAWSNIIPV